MSLVRDGRDNNEEKQKCFLRRTESANEKMAKIPAEKKAQAARQPESDGEKDAFMVCDSQKRRIIYGLCACTQRSESRQIQVSVQLDETPGGLLWTGCFNRRISPEKLDEILFQHYGNKTNLEPALEQAVTGVIDEEETLDEKEDPIDDENT